MSVEDIDLLFTRGVYLKTRTIYLGGMSGDDSADQDVDPGIQWNTARRLLLSLHLLEANAPKGDKPITILMNSVGGDWSHGMAIYDAIRSAKNHVTIINLSHARSMTSLIFQAADYRVTAPNGYYLIHDGSFGVEAQPQTVITNVDYERTIAMPTMYRVYLSRLQELDDEGKPRVDINDAAEIINAKLPAGAERIRPSRGIKGVTMSHVEQLCSRDTFFTPTEMIRLNFADRLLEAQDLVGGFVNPKMHGLPIGMASLEDETA